MNIYLIAQKENRTYDTWDSAIVAAPDELTARSMSPESGEPLTEEEWENPSWGWASSIDNVTAELIGTTSDNHEQRLILASFNAG